MIKNIKLFGFLFICISLVPLFLFGEWKEFLSISGNCKVLFPDLPMHSRKIIPLQSSESMYYDLYASIAKGESLYILIIAQFLEAPSVEQEKSSLESFINGILHQGDSNQLKKNEFTTFDGYQALDFDIQGVEGGIQGRAIMVGSRLYLLARQVLNVGEQKEEFEKFIRSFHLLTKALP